MSNTDHYGRLQGGSQIVRDAVQPEPTRPLTAQLQSLEKSIEVLYNVASEVARRASQVMPGGSVAGTALTRADKSNERVTSAPAPLRSPTTDYVQSLTAKVEIVTAILSDINANIEV